MSPITLPFAATGLTNCGSGNDYDAGTSTLCGSILYVGGEDQLYAFTPATSGLVTISVTSGSSYMGVFLFQGCPAGGTCISSAYSAGGSQLLMAPVTAGVTYFIMIDSWPAPSCHPSYDLSVSAPGAMPAPTTQDCFGAIPVCQDFYQELTSPVGEGNYPDEIDGTVSCLGGGEVDGLWYLFTVQTGGLVCFSITPNDLTDDYDWAVYDLTTATCADIFSGVAPEVSCNFSGLPGITGANGLPGMQNEPCIPVNAGETYALYVSNWSQSVNGYTLDFGAGTADIFDLSPPSIDTVLTVSCSHDLLTIQMSEFVLCSSVQPTDLTITGPGGPYTVTAVNSALCGSGGNQDNVYELTISPPLLGGGAYTLSLVDDVEDLCGNIGNSGSVVFDLDPLLQLSAAATGAGCNGLPGEINGVAIGGTFPFTFDLDGLVQINNGLYTGLPAGTYTLTLTDANGCTQDTVLDVLNATTFMDNDSLVANVSCFGLADGSIEVITTGTGGPWDYTWTDSGGGVVQSTTGSNGDTFTGPDGTYTVVIEEGPLGSGCTDTLTATIIEPPQILINASGDTTICLNGSATLSAGTIGGTLPISLTWAPGLVGNGPHSVSPSLDQSYSVFGVDANGCHSDTLDIDVDVLDSLTVAVPDTLYSCPAANVPIAAVAGGGDGSFQYDWGAGPSASATYTAVLYSTATICVTLTDGCETPSVSACTVVIIEPVPPIVLSVDSTLGCQPFEVNFSIVDTTGQANVTWTFGDGSSSVGGDSTAHTYGQDGEFDIGVTVDWPNGCTTDSIFTDVVTVLPLPEADYIWTPNPTTWLDPVISFLNQSIGYDTVLWTFDDLGTSDEVNPVFEFPEEPGLYDVSLWVSNALGCSDSVTYAVEIRDPFLVNVPNSFTPDGDGMNDYFWPVILDVDANPAEYQFSVYDRWGGKVFESTNIANVWNGKQMNGGSEVPQGVYVWKLRARSYTDQRRREYMGHVTLLR